MQSPGHSLAASMTSNRRWAGTSARLPGASLLFEHVLESLDTGARITHRATLSGPLAPLYTRSVRRRTEPGLRDGVERLAALAATQRH